jgi:uncharacterized SAM-binding protein YcdF (DUF218 family)
MTASKLFFVASKLFWAAVSPDNLGLALLIAAFLLGGTRFRRPARIVAGTILTAALVILLTNPAQWLAQPLENRFPHPDWPSCVDGIVMLGGGETPSLSDDRGVPGMAYGAPRIFSSVELMRHYPNARLIFAGGSGVLGGSLSEAGNVKAILEQLGVDLGRVSFEDRSRNTWENEVNALGLAHPTPEQRWVLVTSAAHMPRAAGIAQKLGWPLLPWPVDYSTPPTGFQRPELRFARYLGDLVAVTHEWAGLLAYWAAGRSSALFPAPTPEPSAITCSDRAAVP